MPRLVPQTAFTLTANNAANIHAEKNATLPLPAQTGSKECKYLCKKRKDNICFMMKNNNQNLSSDDSFCLNPDLFLVTRNLGFFVECLIKLNCILQVNISKSSWDFRSDRYATCLVRPLCSIMAWCFNSNFFYKNSWFLVAASTGPISTPTPSKPGRPASPASNVIVLPSGMSVHIKGKFFAWHSY